MLGSAVPGVWCSGVCSGCLGVVLLRGGVVPGAWCGVLVLGAWCSAVPGVVLFWLGVVLVLAVLFRAVPGAWFSAFRGAWCSWCTGVSV